MEFSDDDDYEKQLFHMLNLAEKEFEDIKVILNYLKINEYEELLKEMLITIIKNPSLNKRRKKEYSDFVNSLKNKSSLIQKKLFLYQVILKLSNDFKKDNSFDDLGNNKLEFKSSFNINWNEVNESLKILYACLEKDNGKKK